MVKQISQSVHAENPIMIKLTELINYLSYRRLSKSNYMEPITAR